ncbi:LPS-assembly protein LptD [Candidatus Pelagibacter communis]|uniref:LPS-assembly protein LptD n=1 Tax=Pelagibacter ubique TaxID=198252 RepID=UPI00094CF06C|nr:LPS-assembly protein LptD [Candidatus Pelagibacter ubique]
MKKIILIFIFFLLSSNSFASEQFIFNVTEIEITDDGNKFIGNKNGTAKSDSGIIIDAENFEYNKKLNILNAKGKVKITDTINKYIIFTDEIIYDKEKELIKTKIKSKAFSLNDDITITAEKFEYNKSLNKIIAKNDVKIIDQKEDYKIFADQITYLRNEEKIITKGKTSAIIKSKYDFNSKDVLFLKNSMELSSKKFTSVKDKKNLYNLKKFKYLINEEKLFGEDILISTNFKSPKNDKFYFSSGIVDLKTQNFIAKDTKINLHKSLFDNSENDPRLNGVSSIKNENIVTINKGVFTSCKETDTCPPWSIQADEIKHDKNKKQLNYKNAIVRLYDFPILYFPKFFHPDPTVKRQSGFLKPILNNSNVLGSSFTVPYYSVLSEHSDLTTAPLFFDSKTKMIQNEFRSVGEKYSFKGNFGHTRKYESSLQNKNKNISYIFSNLKYDLEFDDFETSKFYINIEKITNDTFLKVFDSNLIDDTTSLKPQNKDSLSSEFKFTLDKEEFNLTTGFQSFENLQLSNNDRYQYILPYYNFNTTLFPSKYAGSLRFSSSGSNNLNNTNQLKSQITNNLDYSSLDYVSEIGVKNNFNIKLKNLNSVGKNISEYKSSPEIEISSLVEFNSTLPLKKIDNDYISLLSPKLSLRANPGDMKNYKTDSRTITPENIFSLNRLGLDDSLESGKSLTIGFDYRKEKLENMNKYFELKLASVLRDKEENFIPENTTLNKKTSNIYGSLSNNFSENLKLDYNFAIDNNLNEIQYNDIKTTLTINNFVTSFNFIKEINEMGDQNLIENRTSFKVDENNYLSFNTRRNRKLDLTEYYDLIYEYKNDCLTAGIKYNKTYYEDRDLKPTENLFFSLTLFPLTTYEQKIDQ